MKHKVSYKKNINISYHYNLNTVERSEVNINFVSSTKIVSWKILICSISNDQRIISQKVQKTYDLNGVERNLSKTISLSTCINSKIFGKA